MYSKGRKLGMNIAGKFKKKSGDCDDKEQQSAHDISSEMSSETVGGMKSPGQQIIPKCSSMGSLHNDSTVSERTIVNQDEIIKLTQDVKGFSDGLARLKSVFVECTESKEDLKVQAHERLGEVLFVLKNILHNYQALQSTELFAASGALISKVKNYDYTGTSTTSAEQSFCEAIDQLALAFSSSVSEYLMGDLDTSFVEKGVKTKSYDNLMGDNAEETEQKNTAKEPVMAPIEVDTVLSKLQAGVDVALQRAKAWSKYMKDITAYIERKAQLESDYSKNLARLAQSMKPILTEEGFLPLQSVYCTVLSQDKDYASTCQATQSLLQASKFVEPLTARRLEHDKMRKNIKDSWLKELKRMQDAVHSLRKAQTLYLTRQMDYEKAKEQANKMESDMLSQSSSSSALTKVDKRRKMEEEALHKAAEAETTYKACVAEANSRQQELRKTKNELIARIREQIYLCDQVIKVVTLEYFHLLQTVTTPIPIQFQTLSEATKQYEPGMQFQEFVRRLPVKASQQANTEPFVFESYVPSSAREADARKTSTQSTGSSGPHSEEGSPQPASPRKDRYRVPVKAWSPGVVAGSDTDSASGSSKSLDSSPSNSPHPTGHRKLLTAGSLDDLDEVNDIDQGLLSIPGSDAGEVKGILKPRGQRRNTTFGVDFQEQVQHCRSAVPPIVIACLKEIEKRGITFEGIYRKSGVKSKVEHLCQRFEKDPESIDLSEEHPNVISNVLKLYLRELPEPLLTFKQYAHFIKAAKEMNTGNSDKQETVCRLQDIVSQLPYSNLKTCATLMHHLNRIASYSSINHMTASNLGIVLGPTLLRPLEGTSSLASLVDMPHQTRAVELLITMVQDVFGPESEFELIPGETPVEQLADDKSNKTLAPPPRSPPSASAEKKSQPQEPKSESVAEKAVEQLIKGEHEDTESKNSVADFVLPGSAHSDKKDSNSPTVTISDGSDTEDIDIDDDLPDTLLPDDSHPSPTLYCHQEGRAALSNNARVTNQSPEKEISGKASPPQQLKLTSPQLMSPETARKMMVPTINIIDSSPVGDKAPQAGFTSKPSKAQSKKLNQSWPSQSSKKSQQGKSSSDSGISLKSVGPSIQSFIVSTAKSIFSDNSKQNSSKNNSESAKNKNVSSNVGSADVESRESDKKSGSKVRPSSQPLSIPSSPPGSPKSPSLAKKSPTPPTFSPQLSRQNKQKPAVAPKPNLGSIGTSTSLDDSQMDSHPSPILKPKPTSTSNLSSMTSSPVLTRYTAIKSEENVSKPPPKVQSSPHLVRQSTLPDELRAGYAPYSSSLARSDDATSSRYTPQSPRFSPGLLRHSSSSQSSSLATSKAGPSPTLSRKSLSLADHSVKSGRLSPRPLSSPLLFRQTSLSPTFKSDQCETNVKEDVSTQENETESDLVKMETVNKPVFTFETLTGTKSDDLDALFKTGMESQKRRSLKIDEKTDEALKSIIPVSAESSVIGKTCGETGNLLTNGQALKRPKLPEFHADKTEYGNNDKMLHATKTKDSDLLCRSESDPSLYQEKSDDKNRNEMASPKKMTPREEFMLGIGNTDSTVSANISSDQIIDQPVKKQNKLESKEDVNVVLKIIEDNFSGKGDEQEEEDLSVVSGYVYEPLSPVLTSPRLAPRSEEVKSEQSSYSLSSHSSISDMDDSITSSDVSPELSRSLVSLPKPKKVSVTSGFPDFSPILPRQKDIYSKKHDSCDNSKLPPSCTFPLSGNLSTMTTIPENPLPEKTASADDKVRVCEVPPLAVCTMSTSVITSPQPVVNTSPPSATSPYTLLTPSEVIISSTASPYTLSTSPVITKSSPSTVSSILPMSTASQQADATIVSSSSKKDNSDESYPSESADTSPSVSDQQMESPKMIRSKPYYDLHSKSLSQVTGSLAKIISPLIATSSGNIQYQQSSTNTEAKQKPPQVECSTPLFHASKIPISPKIKRSFGTNNQSSASKPENVILSTIVPAVSIKTEEKKPSLTGTEVLQQSPQTVQDMKQKAESAVLGEAKSNIPSSLNTRIQSPRIQTKHPHSSQRPQPIGREDEEKPPPVKVKEVTIPDVQPISTETTMLTKASDSASSQRSVETESDKHDVPTVAAPTTVPKDSKSKSPRTSVQTSKSVASKEPGKTTKGPSGIVMGKAAILPGRGSRSTTTGGRKSPAVGASTSHVGRKSQTGGSASSVGGRKSPAVGMSTGGRKSPAVTSGGGKSPALIGHEGRSSPSVGSTNLSVVQRSTGQKKPSMKSHGCVSAELSSARKTTVSSSSSCSSPRSSVSCSTCGRRKTSVSRTSSEPTQQITLTSYRRMSSTSSSAGDSPQGQRSGTECKSESKDSESQGKKKVIDKGQTSKVVRGSTGTGTRKERVPYFV